MKVSNKIFLTIGYVTTILVILTIVYFILKGLIPATIGNGLTNTSDSAQPSTQTNVYCTRTTPYPMPPEFLRAISIRNQRLSQVGSINPDPNKNIHNCLDIQYADLSSQQAEGMFLFDPTSSPDDLKILVDNSYREYDDYLTAILLSHEITHAEQFDNESVEGIHETCYEKEDNAFISELNLFRALNPEERSSLLYKILQTPQKNSAYEGLYSLLQITLNALHECGNSTSTCYNQSVQTQISDMVKNNPAYQQECGVNQN